MYIYIYTYILISTYYTTLLYDLVNQKRTLSFNGRTTPSCAAPVCICICIGICICICICIYTYHSTSRYHPKRGGAALETAMLLL